MCRMIPSYISAVSTSAPSPIGLIWILGRCCRCSFVTCLINCGSLFMVKQGLPSSCLCAVMFCGHWLPILNSRSSSISRLDLASDCAANVLFLHDFMRKYFTVWRLYCYQCIIFIDRSFYADNLCICGELL